MKGSADPHFKSARSSDCIFGPEQYKNYLPSPPLTRVGAPQFLGFLLSDLPAPPVGVLVGVELEEQHRVDSQGNYTADWGNSRRWKLKVNVFKIQSSWSVFSAPGVIEGTLSTAAVGKTSRLARLKMCRISPVVSEMVPWQRKEEQREFGCNPNSLKHSLAFPFWTESQPQQVCVWVISAGSWLCGGAERRSSLSRSLAA